MDCSTIGVIYGNRDFFPDHLITEARVEVASLLASLGINEVSLESRGETLGDVSTYQDARRCAELFRQQATQLDGVLVCLPNFGDEKAVADTLRLAGLSLPVLVQAYPDDPARLSVERRRDAYCGKISVCNNLRQYGLPFTLPQRHVDRPDSAAFKSELLDRKSVV